MTTTEQGVRNLVDNVYLTILGRFAIIFASVVALPVAGFMGVALMERLDSMLSAQQQTAIMMARFEDRFTVVQGALAEIAADRYRATDAARDLRLQDAKNDEQDRVNAVQDKRLDDHEQRLNVLSSEITRRP